MSPRAVRPAAVTSPNTRWTPAASTSTPATCAPSRAKRTAPARPMPEAAAVTIPIFPARRMGSRVPAELLRLADGPLGDHDVHQCRAAERHRLLQRALQIFRVLDEPALAAER